MKTGKLRRGLLGVALLLLLSACSGSRGDITGTGDDPGASDEGEVQGYGSIIVNGTHYRSDAATEILIDGAPAAEADLKLGMQVEVELASAQLGEDGSRARRISARAALEGNIESLDPEQGLLVVLGIPVQADLLSRIYGASGEVLALSDLAVGMTVRIGGWRLGVQGFVASVIHQRETRSEDFVLRGRVAGHDAAQMRFFLHGLEVDYSAASVVERPSGQLDNGDLVRVRGEMDGQQRLFRARELHELRDVGERPQRARLRGQISLLDGSWPERQFLLRDRLIRTHAGTRYLGGGCADLEEGRRALVRGVYSADGSVRADELLLAPGLDALVLAPLEDKRPLPESDGCELSVFNDLRIVVDRYARHGRGRDGARRFVCRDAALGEHIVVLGAFDSGPAGDRITAVLAGTQEEFGDEVPPAFQDLSVVGGQVQSLSRAGRRIDLLGRRVQFSDSTEFPESSEQAFFDQTRPGDPVSVVARWNGALLEALSVRRGLRRNPGN